MILSREVDSLEIFKPHKVYLSLHKLTEIYALLKVSHTSEGFFDLVRTWRKSDVYEIPCGYLRFEPYPLHKAATVHGIFVGNPFPHIQLIKEMLIYYMGLSDWLDTIECVVPINETGIAKLVRKIAHTEKKNEAFIFFNFDKGA